MQMRCGKRSSVDTQNLEGFASQDRQEQAASVIARFIRFASVQKRLSKQLGGKVGVAGAVAGQLASPKKPKDRRSKAAANKAATKRRGPPTAKTKTPVQPQHDEEEEQEEEDLEPADYYWSD